MEMEKDPFQMMMMNGKVRADKGEDAIVRLVGSSPVIAASCEEGIVFLTRNSKLGLRYKINEADHRIAFAVIGDIFETRKYSKFIIHRAGAMAYMKQLGTVLDLAQVVAEAFGEMFLSPRFPMQVKYCFAETGKSPDFDNYVVVQNDGFMRRASNFVVLNEDLTDDMRRYIEALKMQYRAEHGSEPPAELSIRLGGQKLDKEVFVNMEFAAEMNKQLKKLYAQASATDSAVRAKDIIGLFSASLGGKMGVVEAVLLQRRPIRSGNEVRFRPLTSDDLASYNEQK